MSSWLESRTRKIRTLKEEEETRATLSESWIRLRRFVFRTVPCQQTRCPRLSTDRFAFAVSHSFVISRETTRLIGNRKKSNGGRAAAYVPEITLWQMTEASGQIHLAVSSASVFDISFRDSLKFLSRTSASCRFRFQMNRIISTRLSNETIFASGISSSL